MAVASLLAPIEEGLDLTFTMDVPGKREAIKNWRTSGIAKMLNDLLVSAKLPIKGRKVNAVQGYTRARDPAVKEVANIVKRDHGVQVRFKSHQSTYGCRVIIHPLGTETLDQLHAAILKAVGPAAEVRDPASPDVVADVLTYVPQIETSRSLSDFAFNMSVRALKDTGNELEDESFWMKALSAVEATGKIRRTGTRFILVDPLPVVEAASDPDLAAEPAGSPSAAAPVPDPDGTQSPAPHPLTQSQPSMSQVLEGLAAQQAGLVKLLELRSQLAQFDADQKALNAKRAEVEKAIREASKAVDGEALLLSLMELKGNS